MLDIVINTIQLIGGVILSIGYIPQIRQILKTKSVKDFNLNYVRSIASGVGCMEVYAIYQFSQGAATMFFVTNTIAFILALVMLILCTKYRKG